MYCIVVNDFENWRDSARQLLLNKIKPELIEWTDGAQQSLFMTADALSTVISNQTIDNNFFVPKGFIQLAKMVSYFDDAGHQVKKWALLYSLLWRLVYESKETLSLHSDKDVSALYRMVKAVNRDRHKMKAFVRFKASDDISYRAWFEPEHYIVESLSSFFVSRFTGMNWSILTPKGCIHWDQTKLKITPGMANPELEADQYDEFWKTYYCAIFNPARLKEKAMLSEMPKKYWKYLPEASCIKALTTGSAATMNQMMESNATEPERVREYSNAVTKFQDELREINKI